MPLSSSLRSTVAAAAAAALFLLCPRLSTAAAISVGDKLPDSTFSYFNSSDHLRTLIVSDLTMAREPSSSPSPAPSPPPAPRNTSPSFVRKAGELRSKGVDAIACISVNDAFVMRAWRESLKVGDEVLLLSDGNGDFGD